VRKIIFLSTLILIVIAGFFIYWNYYNTYSEGNRSGILQKFSRKGNVFKTYEGELIMSSIASTGNVTLASEKFFFSVKNDSVAKVLFDLEGKHITVHYEQKRHSLAWNGDTEYMVTGVKKDE
jgi:pectate lyase